MAAVYLQLFQKKTCQKVNSQDLGHEPQGCAKADCQPELP
jgi:hypothetical protein